MAIPYQLFLFPVLATLAGGLLAVRFRQWLHLLLAFGAGLLLGAAFLDLLPESVELGRVSGQSVSHVMMMVLLSLLGFFALESALDSFSSCSDSRIPRISAGHVGGAMLIFHSFRDGMAIGAAFAASHPAGYAVAVGIAAHDLGDGVNTVLLTTGGRKPGSVDYGFLVADAIAPMAGGLLALHWFASATSSVVMLAIAAGFFIQMAASDFLPEVRRSTVSRMSAMVCLLVGVGIIYVANRLILSLH